MPQVVAALGTTAFTVGATAVTVGNIITAAYVIGSAYEGARKARSMQRAARQDYLNSLQDRNLTIRSAIAPKTTVYGVDRKGGTLVDMFTTGDRQQYLHQIIELAGHPCHSVPEVYLNEWGIADGDIDGNGNVTDSRWAKTETHTVTDYYTTADGAGQITLSHAADTLVSVMLEGQHQEGPAAAAGTLAPGGATVTGLTAGRVYTIVFTWVETHSRVRIHKFLGAPGETVPTALLDETAGRRTAAHTPAGITWLWVRIEWDAEVFGSIGLPNVSALVKGKLVYDPRTTATAWTDNWALCVRDYLRDPLLGIGCTAAEVPDAEIAAQANISDELIDLDALATHQQARYTINGTLSAGDARLGNLAQMLSAGAGSAVWSQGRWRVRAGAHPTPEPITLTVDHLAGPPRVQGAAPRRQLFNAVTAAYREPSAGYVTQKAPQVVNALYEADDGGRRIDEPLQLTMVADTWRAQRLAKITLERARQAEAIDIACNLRAYDLAVGSVVPVTIARYGWSAKLFEVRQRDLEIAAGSVRYTLVATDPSVWDWNYGLATEVDPAPNTNLPNPFLTPPAPALTLTTGTDTLLPLQDGTMLARVRADWTLDAGTSIFVLRGGRIELRWQRQGATQWQTEPNMPGDSTRLFLGPLDEGLAVTVQVRAVTATGRPSLWASAAIVVVGKSQPPSDVENFTGTAFAGGIDWTWTPCPDIDYAHTEVRDSDADWGSDVVEPLYRGRASGWPETNASASAITRYARHIDTSGNVSVTAASASATPIPAAAGAHTLRLRPATMTVTATPAGTVVDWSTATTTAQVIDPDGVDVTADWGLTLTDSPNLVASLGGALNDTVTVTDFDAGVVQGDYANAVIQVHGYPTADDTSQWQHSAVVGANISFAASGGVAVGSGYMKIGNGYWNGYFGHFGIGGEPITGVLYGQKWSEGKAGQSMRIPGPAPWIMEAYVRVVAYESATNGTQLHLFGAHGARSINIVQAPSGFYITCNWQHAHYQAASSLSVSSTVTSGSAVLNYGQWYHVRAAYSTTGHFRMWIDGVRLGAQNEAFLGTGRMISSVYNGGYDYWCQIGLGPGSYGATGPEVHLQEVRLLAGVDTSGVSFTPPSEVFSDSPIPKAGAVVVEAAKAGQTTLSQRADLVVLPGQRRTASINVSPSSGVVDALWSGGTTGTGTVFTVTAIVDGRDDTSNGWTMAAFGDSTSGFEGGYLSRSGNTLAVTGMSSSQSQGFVDVWMFKSGFSPLLQTVVVNKSRSPQPAQSWSATTQIITLAGDSAGHVDSYTGAASTIQVREGGTLVSGYYYAVSTTSGLSATVSASPHTLTSVVLTITAITDPVDAGTVTLTLTKSGWPSISISIGVIKTRLLQPSGAVAPALPTVASYFESGLGSSGSAAVRINGDGTIERRSGDPGSWVAAGNWYNPTTAGVGTGRYVRLPALIGDGAYASGSFGGRVEIGGGQTYSIGDISQPAGSMYATGMFIISDASGATLGTGQISIISHRESS